MGKPIRSELPLHLLQRLATSAEMRAMDTRAIEQLGLPARQLMENAARAVVARVLAELGPREARGPVVVCCGSGNNGGDGYAVARLLADHGLAVAVLALGTPGAGAAGDNAAAWATRGEIVDAEAEAERCVALLGQAAAIVDALFGTGLSRPMADAAGRLCGCINAATARTGTPVVGVDVPSGVNADTGQVSGAAVRCTHTVCLQVGKPGCYQQPGASYAGAVEVVPIAIPEHWADAAPPTYRLTEPFAAALLPERPPDAHKGTFGHLLTVCGSAGMGGAALLAALGALKIGTGLVTAGVPRGLRDGFLAAAPELMTLSAEQGDPRHFTPEQAPLLLEAAAERSAVVLGCGLGRLAETGVFARRVVAEVAGPLLIDADGLYHLQPEHLRSRAGATVITPHPGELGRLAGLHREELAAQRIGVARRLAADWGVVLVLKGAATVVAEPGGAVFLNSTGDQALASGGTGDVLSGIVGGLLAQGLAPLPAALLGVYLHGLARDCQREQLAAAYFTATDLIAGINPALHRLGAP